MAGELGSGLRYANLKQQLAREKPAGKKGGSHKMPNGRVMKDEDMDEEYMGRKMGSNSRMMECPDEEEGTMEREEGSNTRMMNSSHDEGGDTPKPKKGNPFAIGNAMAKKHRMGPAKKERLIRHLKDEGYEA